MRTLIISDLHLGARNGHDVLRRSAPRERLLESLQDVDRLVLLGDAVELMEGRAGRALAVAEPVLRAIGSGLPGGAQVVVVPGNHDAPLIRRWLRTNRSRLETETEVPKAASTMLTRLCEWLGAARTEIRYPGIWLTPRVWATHGHYVDRDLMPHHSWGISRGWLRGLPQGPAVPGDYERGRGSSRFGLRGLVPEPVLTGLENGANLLRGALMAPIRRRLLNPRIAPMTSSLLALQLRLIGVPSLANIVRRLDVQAEFIVFGHVHRLGPLNGEDPIHWQGVAQPTFLNCGSWLYEPLLVHRASAPHPYWPGGAVVLDDDSAPRTVGLLDDLSAEELRPAPRRAARERRRRSL